jgi:hypothetical protein
MKLKIRKLFKSGGISMFETVFIYIYIPVYSPILCRANVSRSRRLHFVCDAITLYFLTLSATGIGTECACALVVAS